MAGRHDHHNLREENVDPRGVSEVGWVRAGPLLAVMKRPRSRGGGELLGRNTEDDGEPDESSSLKSSWFLVSWRWRLWPHAGGPSILLDILYCLVWQVAWIYDLIIVTKPRGLMADHRYCLRATFMSVFFPLVYESSSWDIDYVFYVF